MHTSVLVKDAKFKTALTESRVHIHLRGTSLYEDC